MSRHRRGRVHHRRRRGHHLGQGGGGGRRRHRGGPDPGAPSGGHPAADRSEHDVARAWRRGPRRAFAAVSSELDGPAAGVVVTSMVPSITAVDRRGSPLLPGLLYGDTRARRPVRTARRPDRRAPRAATGTPRMLGWAVGQRPGGPGYWNCQAMATHALTGVPAVDRPPLLSFGGLYARGRWDKRGARPTSGWTGAAAGGGADGRRDRHGARDRPTVFAGGSIDAFCEQIVAGANQPGRRAGHLRGHPHRVGGDRRVEGRAGAASACPTPCPVCS